MLNGLSRKPSSSPVNVNKILNWYYSIVLSCELWHRMSTATVRITSSWQRLCPILKTSTVQWIYTVCQYSDNIVSIFRIKWEKTELSSGGRIVVEFPRVIAP